MNTQNNASSDTLFDALVDFAEAEYKAHQATFTTYDAYQSAVTTGNVDNVHEAWRDYEIARDAYTLAKLYYKRFNAFITYHKAIDKYQIALAAVKVIYDPNNVDDIALNTIYHESIETADMARKAYVSARDAYDIFNRVRCGHALY